MNIVKHLVIGGGVVGLATAARLSVEGTTILVEKNRTFGEESSSHNSEVIHAGIYYPPNSLKTKTSIKGRKMLYSLCNRFSIPYHKMGKWIISSSEGETPSLLSLRANAKESEVPVYFLSKKEIEKEQNVKATQVLFSPETGIIDTHQLMVFLSHAIATNGGEIAFRTRITDVSRIHDGYMVEAKDDGGGAPFLLKTESVVNCGGLWADKNAKMIMKDKYPQQYNIHYCKGHYFSYNGPLIMEHPHLLYPIPEPGLRGLGVHATYDMKGNVRFGPDTKYVSDIDYSFQQSSEVEQLRDNFYSAIIKYLPGIDKDKLKPDYTGIRAKLSGPLESVFKDFIIKSEEEFPGLVNLIGIESPGMTACLAIAEEVAYLLGYKKKDQFEIKS